MRNITITTAKSATYLENVGQHGPDASSLEEAVQRAGSAYRRGMTTQDWENRRSAYRLSQRQARIDELKVSDEEAGSLDAFQQDEKTLTLTGWAGFPGRKLPATHVALVRGGRILFVAPADRARPDVAGHYDQAALNNSGFYLNVDKTLFWNTHGDISLYAINGDLASRIFVREDLKKSIQ